MITTAEFGYCRRVAMGEERLISAKKAFKLRQDEAVRAVEEMTKRADIGNMIAFLLSDEGANVDEMTKLVNLRNSAYNLAVNEEVKPTDRAAMMKQYRDLTTEIKRLEASQTGRSKERDQVAAELRKLKESLHEEEGQEETEVLTLAGAGVNGTC